MIKVIRCLYIFIMLLKISQMDIDNVKNVLFLTREGEDTGL